MKINEKVLKTFQKVLFVISVTLKFLLFLFSVYLCVLFLMNDAYGFGLDFNSLIKPIGFILCYCSVIFILDFFNGVAYGCEAFNEEKKEISEEEEQ